MVDRRRVRAIRSSQFQDGPVVYLMSRDQRVEDNWALLYAQQLALEHKQQLVVACPIVADYPRAPRRQTEFMLTGLTKVEARLSTLNIPLVATAAAPVSGIISLIDGLHAGMAVCDFNPLKESLQWKAQLVERVKVPIYEVDAHNIVPVWETSEKQEYAAYTIRPKIRRRLNEFLTPFPELVRHPFSADVIQFPAVWSPIDTFLDISVERPSNLSWESGEPAAQTRLQKFFVDRLPGYNDLRNDPTRTGQSDLSPYIHFGQLSAQRVALEAQRHDAHIASQEAFLEELVVRRELADNFCYYNDKYDFFDGFPLWAQTTLNDHRADPRSYLYGRDMLEAAQTHDELWNAAQTEMVVTGKMHGYLRMYWAKKILEWSATPEAALEQAIYLNNRYELDGNDPNGYVGIAWSIGGVHDRAWSEREIFGKIRYMSSGGCQRKFSVADYIARMTTLKSKVIA